MDRPAVVIHHSKCTGCRICIEICSTLHEGGISESGSRISVTHAHPGFDVAMTCCQCSDPPCVPVCPVDAITFDSPTAPILIDSELCTACGDCIDECPIEAIWYHPSGDYAIKCDLCKDVADTPQCVEMCPSDCLEFKDYRSEPRQTPAQVAESLRKNLFGLKVIEQEESK